MPNAFGGSTSATPGYALFDPRDLPKHRARFRRPELPQLALANSLYVPGGCAPARGWIVLRREDYDKIDTWSVDLQLEIDGFERGVDPLKFGHLVVVQAQCVTRGFAADLDALYLVELTDKRGVLSNCWFAKHTASQYNVRAPAYPGDYYVHSLSGSASWSWSALLQDLWAQMPLLGQWPGLPITPAGTPENWILPGVPVWEAFCRILDHLGMTAAVDLTSTGAPYTIVRKGAADTAFDDLVTKYAVRLEDDLEAIDTGSGRAPGTVVVLFHKRWEYYGTEETVRRDDKQWQGNAIYSVSVAAPGYFSAGQGTGYLWDDFTVRIDQNGNPLDADVASAAARARERADQFFDKIFSATLGTMQRTYAGPLPFKTGSKVDGICWKQDVHDMDQRLAWRTEVRRGELWPEMSR